MSAPKPSQDFRTMWQRFVMCLHSLLASANEERWALLILSWVRGYISRMIWEVTDSCLSEGTESLRLCFLLSQKSLRVLQPTEQNRPAEAECSEEIVFWSSSSSTFKDRKFGQWAYMVLLAFQVWEYLHVDGGLNSENQISMLFWAQNWRQVYGFRGCVLLSSAVLWTSKINMQTDCIKKYFNTLCRIQKPKIKWFLPAFSSGGLNW